MTGFDFVVLTYTVRASENLFIVISVKIHSSAIAETKLHVLEFLPQYIDENSVGDGDRNRI